MKNLLNNYNGVLTCTRYAFMPNKLKYCGGDRNNQLFEYGVSQVADPFLTELLREFETLYPYLKLIAENNRIKDAFDPQIIEAYWLGNELLEKNSMNKFYWHLADHLKLKKKLPINKFIQLIDNIDKNAMPYHNYHVLNIWIRTGHLAIKHTLETMNKCRISWGKVIKKRTNSLIVLSPQLIYLDNKLTLSKPQEIEVQYNFQNKSFFTPELNQYISIHWDWACDVLSEKQVQNLIKYTNQSIFLANKATPDS